jgi:hypothetical protein
MRVRALYCEMNRFEINPDEWYLNAFAYDFFGDPEDLGWLVGWKQATKHGDRFVLRRMGDLQALFARDYGDEPPDSVRAASEVVILLLTLRMQQMVHAAARQAREAGRLPDDVPVLAAAHDSDLVSFCYGPVMPPVTRSEPERPAAPRPPRSGASLGIYKMDGGYDEFGNSLPWDVLDYVRERDWDKYGDRLDKAEPLADSWKAPREPGSRLVLGLRAGGAAQYHVAHDLDGTDGQRRSDGDVLERLEILGQRQKRGDSPP